MPQDTQRFTPLDTPQQPRFTPLDAGGGGVQTQQPRFTPLSNPQTSYEAETSALLHGDLKRVWEIERPKYTGGGLPGLFGAKRDPALDAPENQFATPTQQRQGEPAWSTTDPYSQQHPYQRAFHDLGASFTSPEQIAMLMGTGGAGEVGNAANLAFKAQMLHGGVQGGANAYNAYKQGNTSEAKYQGVTAAASMAMGMLPESRGGGETPRRFTPLDRPSTEATPSISKQPASAAIKSASPPPTGLEAFKAAKGVAGGAQPNVTAEGGPRPVSDTGMTAANQPGEAKGTAPSDTAFVGEKQVKIQSQQVTGPNRAAWEAQSRSSEIDRLKAVVANSAATPHERAIAKQQIAMHQETAPGQQDVDVKSIAAKLGVDHYATTDTPSGLLHNIKDPVSGGSVDILQKDLSEANLQKRIDAVRNIPRDQLSDVAQQKATTPQGAPRFTPIATPKPFEPSKTAPSQTQGRGVGTAQLLADQAAKGRISEADAASTANRAGVGEVKPQGKLEALGSQVADLRERTARPAGSGPTRNALPKQTAADITADKELLDRVQATKTATPPKEPVGAPKATASTSSKPSTESTAAQPVRGREVAPDTPAKGPEKSQDATKAESGSDRPAAPQPPLETALKPKSDPSQSGAFSFGGKPKPAGRAALASRMVSKRLDLTLQELAAPQGADYLRGVEALKQSKGKQSDYEAIYHNLEDPSHKLTPDQQRIKAAEVDTWEQEQDRVRDKLRPRGVPLNDYVHRIALARGAKLERVVTQGMKYSSGARLSKSAAGLKGRTMLNMDVPGYGRNVVHVKDGDVTAYVNGKAIPLGARADLEASGAKFNQATTKEIEASTPQKYFKNALVSSMLNTLELRRAERASDAMEEFKKDPDFKYVAKRTGTETPPSGWGESQVPQLRGYSFEPRTREVLDRYWKDVTKGEPGAFEKINDWLRTSIFFNPLMHTKNIAVHWAVEKGVTGLLPNKWHGIIKDGIQAAQDVFSQNDNFKFALDEGSPLQSHRRTNREFESLLVSKMVQQMQGNKTFGQRMADTLGYANPAKLAKAVYDFSNKATWTFDDIMRLQATYQHMREQKTDFRTSMAEVNKHLPDYRIPTRILDSPDLSNLMRNKNLTMFGAYHYGALKSYMEMAKDLVGKQVPVAQRAKALDRLAMLGLITAAFYPMADQLAKRVTGKQDARVDRSGASTFIDNLYRVIRGEKGLYTAGTAIATPAAGPQIAIRMAQNRALSMVSPQHTQPVGKQLWEATKDVGSQVGPVGQAKSSKFDPMRFFYGMLGVRYGQTPKGGSSAKLPRMSNLKGIGRISQ